MERAFSCCPETAAEAQSWTERPQGAHALHLKSRQWLGPAVFQQGFEEPSLYQPFVNPDSTSPCLFPIPTHLPTEKILPLVSGKKEWRDGRKATLKDKYCFLKRDPSLPSPSMGRGGQGELSLRCKREGSRESLVKRGHAFRRRSRLAAPRCLLLTNLLCPLLPKQRKMQMERDHMEGDFGWHGGGLRVEEAEPGITMLTHPLTSPS